MLKNGICISKENTYFDDFRQDYVQMIRQWVFCRIGGTEVYLSVTLFSVLFYHGVMYFWYVFLQVHWWCWYKKNKQRIPCFKKKYFLLGQIHQTIKKSKDDSLVTVSFSTVRIITKVEANPYMVVVANNKALWTSR